MDGPHLEDSTIRRILAVTLDPQYASSSENPPVLHLAGLAQVNNSTLNRLEVN